MVTESELIPKNNAELIEMERLMRSAPEPGASTSVTMGDEPIKAKNISVSAGHVTMWNTDTREPSDFNLNAVRAKLREVFPPDYENNPLMRGRACWTAIEPSEPPFVGSITCLLHPSRPERAEFDALGYPRCNFNVCANEMEARRHLEKKHPGVHRMMQEARGELERSGEAKNRDTMSLILAKLAGVDLNEPVVEPMSVEITTVIGVTPETVTIDAGTLTVGDFDPATTTSSTEMNHVHKYPKALGSTCVMRECISVRTTPFKARKKK